MLDYPQATEKGTVTMIIPNPLRYFVVDASTPLPTGHSLVMEAVI